MNFGLYGLYTVLLTIGFNYQIALTFVFILGVGLSFLFNHKWSWNDRSNAKTSFLRFCVIYSFIYLAHLSITTALVNYTLLGEYIAGLVSMIFLVVPQKIVRRNLKLLSNYWTDPYLIKPWIMEFTFSSSIMGGVDLAKACGSFFRQSSFKFVMLRTFSIAFIVSVPPDSL